MVAVLDAVMYFGRQIGYAPSGPQDDLWGWLGVWPLAVVIASTTWCVIVAGTPRPGILLAALVPFVAGWALDRMSLAKVIEQQTEAGHLDNLTARENEVLDLISQGLSNAAVSDRLHLSIKTVEPVVSSIFVKLGLPADADNNRRVLAVLAYLRR